MQANHQAITGCIPSMSDWFDQIYDHPRDRRSVLILVESDPANLLAGRVDPIVVSGQKRIRQIGIRKVND
jgi:hypothetical protein